MENGLCTAFIVVLLTFTFQESIDSFQEECNHRKWMMCEKGMSQTGQYSLPKYVRVENFLCDTETDGGRWIIFQRRFKKDTQFNRTWNEYKIGFGSKCNDHWLGNDYLHIATKYGKYELRIDMVFQGKTYFAQYSDFKVGSEVDNYRLTAKSFTGNVTSNDIAYHNGQPFSTIDRDNPPGGRHCGSDFNSGWWFHTCVSMNLNGEFDKPGYLQGVNWQTLTGENELLSSVEMKLRLRLFHYELISNALNSASKSGATRTGAGAAKSTLLREIIGTSIYRDLPTTCAAS